MSNMAVSLNLESCRTRKRHSRPPKRPSTVKHGLKRSHKQRRCLLSIHNIIMREPESQPPGRRHITDLAPPSNVFLGLALDKQNRHDDAEKAYGAAIKAKDRDALAWQGLVAVYEKQGQSRVDDYRRAAIRLVHVFEEQWVDPSKKFTRAMF